MDDVEKLNKNLEYMSKSKCSLYNQCPYAFKLNYVDKHQQESNIYFEIGIDVHNFIEHLFNEVKFNGNKLIIPKMEITKNIEYKKNVLRHVIEKWNECLEIKPENPQKYFLPVLNEKKMIIENPQLIGIIDRLHYNFNDELVIVENKTGKPNAKKVQDYRKDLLWYKYILKLQYGYDVSKGEMYFPYDNSVFKIDIDENELPPLIENINLTREKIKMKIFPAKPSKENCRGCNHRKYCDVKI